MHYLETYLRCFCFEQLNQWSKWLPWAEFCYNTSFQSAVGITLFEAVYGKIPPTLKWFLPGEIRVLTMEEELMLCDKILIQLKGNLAHAQHRMKISADKHKRDVHFSGG